MNATLGGTINEALVERLIRLRPKTRSAGECPEVENLALVLAGYAQKEQVRAATGHLGGCPSCAEAVLELNSMVAQGMIEPLQSADKPARTPAYPELMVKRWRSAALAAAAVLVVGLAAVYFWQPSKEHPYDPGSKLAIKGSADNLFVAVQRGPSQFTARPFDRLEEGDQLGLFYSAETPGYLAVFSLDGEGEASLLYPAEGIKSAAIAANERVPLSDGATVSQGSGCEWIVAVFSHLPLPVDKTAETIRQATRNIKECHLELEISNARTIHVFPVLR
ncbi:MAG: DUF4384 domain-containing protein [Deltaproteobacteria bacterium]|nr:DUF4384 domain-containing protein [Deltaproteobacteria bacterium]